MAHPLFGCVIFDDVTAISGGWACKFDGEPFLFTHSTDLASDVIWVTNASSFDFQRSNIRRPNLRRSTFFGGSYGNLDASINAMFRDMGENAGEISLPEKARLGAEISGEVIRLAMESYPGLKISHAYLYEDIASHLGLAFNSPSQHPYELEMALASSWQHDSGVDSEWAATLKEFAMRRNRVAHAKKVLRAIVPAGGWKYIEGELLGGSSSERIETLLAMNVPALCRVSVVFGGSDNRDARLVAYGIQSRTKKNEAVPRTWTTDRELLLLQAYGKVDFIGAWVAERYESLQERFRLPRMFDDVLSHLSYSAGILAENHLAALDSGLHQGVGDARKSQYSPLAVWVKAADRMHSFESARYWRESGFQVRAYGRGACLVYAGSDEITTLRKAAMSQGCSFPLGLWKPRRIEIGDGQWSS